RPSHPHGVCGPMNTIASSATPAITRMSLSRFPTFFSMAVSSLSCLHSVTCAARNPNRDLYGFGRPLACLLADFVNDEALIGRAQLLAHLVDVLQVARGTHPHAMPFLLVDGHVLDRRIDALLGQTVAQPFGIGPVA